MAFFRLTQSTLLLLILVLFGATVEAELDPKITQLVEENDALLSKEEKTLKRRKELTISEIKDIAKVGSSVATKAKVCITANEASIAKVFDDIGLLGAVAEREEKEVANKRKSLDKVKQSHETQLAHCRLLQLRSSQLVEATQKKEQDLIASRLLSRGKSMLEHIKENLKNPKQGFDSLLEFIVSSSGLEILYQNRYLMYLLIVVSVVGTLVYRRLLKNTIAQQSQKSGRSFTRKLYLSLLTCSTHFMLALSLTACFGLYFAYFAFTNEQFPFVGLVTVGLLLYVLLTFCFRVVLKPVAPATALTGLQTEIAVALEKRLRLLAKLLFVGFLIFSAGNLYEFPDFVIGLARNIYITLLVLNLCWAFWLLGYVRGMANTHIMRTVIILIFLGSMVADWVGYNNLSTYILVGISGSFLAWILTDFIVTLWTEFFNSLDDGEFAWQRFVRSKIGVQPGEYLPGSTGYRFLFAIVVWSMFAIAMLKIWGMPDQNLLLIKEYIIDGFGVGPVHIVPLKILSALLIFALLLSLVGWIKRRLQKSWLNRSRMDRGRKESVIALTGYVGIVLAFLVGVSIAGVELANLALIAGALSVGIGFGLQNVVNNFVSGIVLLFERPIKTGDWIIVGVTQGYVKQIKLRSTMIQTFDRADVIVPNSELISSQVTNWMLNDPVGRVKIPISVAYGSDPRQVEEILLKIANEHPRVVTRSQSVSAPWVVFKEFGDSALLFELRCFISDVDYYTVVLSDINFAVFEAFKKAGIEIPFPQTDIHLVSSNLPLPKAGK
jgi:potassium efflux system protein